MAIKLFLLINAMGVVFLLYVLIHFWEEGREEKSDARPEEIDFMLEERPSVLVVTHLIAHATHGNGSLIPLQLQEKALSGNRDPKGRAATIYEMEVKR